METGASSKRASLQRDSAGVLSAGSCSGCSQMADDFNAYLESLVADELGAARKNGGRRAGQGLDKITEKSGEGCDSSMQTHVEDVEEAKNDDGEAGAERSGIMGTSSWQDTAK